MLKGCLSLIVLLILILLLIKIPAIFIGILLIISGAKQYRKHKQAQTKAKLAPILIIFGLFVCLIGVVDLAIREDNADIAEDASQEVTDEVATTFAPELHVASEIVNDELIVKGETNLPDETVLVVTLQGKEKTITKQTTVSSQSFTVAPIPLHDLQTGEQTYQITLADKQKESVTKIIGENGTYLTGDLVTKKHGFAYAFTVQIPETEKQKTVDKNGKTEKKAAQKKPTHTSGTTAKIPVTLVETIDGDTIKVIYDGQEHNVRYLLIDTPETNHPRLGKQPFGAEAKERNRALVNSGDIYLEFDIGERFDKYGRLLAYVYVGNTLVQEQLLKEGLARVAYVYPPNTRHLDRFEKAEKIAKEKKIGIWSLENYVSDNGYNASSNSHSEKSSATNNTREKTIESAQHNGDVFYKNCTEARNAGVTPLFKGDPGYAKHLDRDGDGVACE